MQAIRRHLAGEEHSGSIVVGDRGGRDIAGGRTEGRDRSLRPGYDYDRGEKPHIPYQHIKTFSFGGRGAPPDRVP